MYAKIFASLWDGTLGDHWEAWATFVYLLATCDAEGFVDKTHSAIARHSNLPLDAVKRGIAILEAPDPHSRSEISEGRRLERIDVHRDWGWRIVNHGYYRTLVDEEVRRDQWRRSQKKSRSQHVSTDALTSQQPSTQAEAEAEAENLATSDEVAPAEPTVEPSPMSPVVQEGVSFDTVRPQTGESESTADPPISEQGKAMSPDPRGLIRSVARKLSPDKPRPFPRDDAWVWLTGHIRPKLPKEVMKFMAWAWNGGTRDLEVIKGWVLEIREKKIAEPYAYFNPGGDTVASRRDQSAIQAAELENEKLKESERAWLKQASANASFGRPATATDGGQDR